MSKIFLLLLVAVAVVAGGCKTHEGSREYIPQNGWEQN
jgi:hypothetical protein